MKTAEEILKSMEDELRVSIPSLKPYILEAMEKYASQFQPEWIKIESEKLILPVDGTECHFRVFFTNENGRKTEEHLGIFNAALGFTSYYDSEHYKVSEITHYMPIIKPEPPKED